MIGSNIRRSLGFAVLAGSVLFTTGCKSGGTWGMPAWPAWGWGGASSANSTALNITKPSTQAPAPVANPGQPTKSLAGGGTYPSAVAATGHVSDTHTSAGPVSGVYPATAQADAYPGRGANTRQAGAEAGGQVAPAAGYQIGPYSMQGKGEPAPNGYAAGRSGGNAPATGAATGPYTSAEGGPAGASGGTDGYRMATQPSGANPVANPWASGGTNPAEGAGGGNIYGNEAAGGDANLYGPVTATDNGAASGLYGPSTAATGVSATTPNGYGPPNTVATGSAAAPRRPATTSPTTSDVGSPAAPSTLPASLTTSGGFRPGSTASPGSRFGVENSGYESQNATATGSDPNVGNLYRR
jgi:hypothetical protein